jgi:hypothetical protein
VRANLGTTRARGEVDMEITLRKMQHKEDKMQSESGGRGSGGCRRVSPAVVWLAGVGAVAIIAGWGSVFTTAHDSNLVHSHLPQVCCCLAASMRWLP